MTTVAHAHDSKVKQPRDRSAVRKESAESPVFRNRVVRFREAAIHHYLCPGGVVRRYVVLESKALRQKLGKPRRCEIDPFEFRDEHKEMRTTDVWESVENEAVKSLRLLYAKVKEIEALESSAEPHVKAIPGKQLPAALHAGSARGQLLYAGSRAGIDYCIDLLDTDTGDVRRITGIDLARALEFSGAVVGDLIRVIQGERHSVTIREQREGSHGEGKATFKRGRPTFEIVRESVSNHSSTGARAA